MNKLLFLALLLALPLNAEEKFKGMAVNVETWVNDSDHIVEICYFRETYQEPKTKRHKGEYKTFGVITSVIKGSLSVGARIDRINFDDQPAGKTSYDRVVEGRIEVVFLQDDDLEKSQKKTMETVGFVPHFNRVSNKHCYEALKVALSKSKPKNK